jgi:hypothetical protein
LTVKISAGQVDALTGLHGRGTIISRGLLDPLFGLGQSQNPSLGLVGMTGLEMIADRALANNVESLFITGINPDLGDAQIDASSAGVSSVLLVMEI